MKKRKIRKITRKITRKKPNRRLSKSRKQTNRLRKTKRRKTTKHHSRKQTRKPKKIKTKPKYSKYSGFYRGGADGYGTLHYKVYKKFKTFFESGKSLKNIQNDNYQTFVNTFNLIKTTLNSLKEKIISELNINNTPTPTPTNVTLKEVVVNDDSKIIKNYNDINEMDFIFRLLFEPNYHQITLIMKDKSTGEDKPTREDKSTGEAKPTREDKSTEKHTITLEIKKREISSIEVEEQRYYDNLKQLKVLSVNNHIQADINYFDSTYQLLFKQYNEFPNKLNDTILSINRQKKQLLTKEREIMTQFSLHSFLWKTFKDSIILNKETRQHIIKTYNTIKILKEEQNTNISILEKLENCSDKSFKWCKDRTNKVLGANYACYVTYVNEIKLLEKKLKEILSVRFNDKKIKEIVSVLLTHDTYNKLEFYIQTQKMYEIKETNYHKDKETFENLKYIVSHLFDNE